MYCCHGAAFLLPVRELQQTDAQQLSLSYSGDSINNNLLVMPMQITHTQSLSWKLKTCNLQWGSWKFQHPPFRSWRLPEGISHFKVRIKQPRSEWNRAELHLVMTRYRDSWPWQPRQLHEGAKRSWRKKRKKSINNVIINTPATISH